MNEQDSSVTAARRVTPPAWLLAWVLLAGGCQHHVQPYTGLEPVRWCAEKLARARDKSDTLIATADGICTVTETPHGTWQEIEYTPFQLKLRETVRKMGL